MVTDTTTDLTGLDALDPRATSARDAGHFRAIIAAAEAVDRAANELREVVDRARAAGESWTVIGAALGVTKQAAQQRFGTPERSHPIPGTDRG